MEYNNNPSKNPPPLLSLPISLPYNRHSNYFTPSMMSEIESCKGYWYYPLYENEQKWERKTPMETTGWNDTIISFLAYLYLNWFIVKDLKKLKG